MNQSKNRFLWLVGLTELDSNKCKAILRYEGRIKKQGQLTPVSTTSDSPTLCDGCRYVDGFGEIATKRLQQPYKIDFSEDDIQEIIDAYHAGRSTTDIAKQFHCGKTTISILLKKHGVVVSKRKAQDKLSAEEVITMYIRDYRTADEIAEHFGVSPQTIRTYLSDHGVKLRTRWDY